MFLAKRVAIDQAKQINTRKNGHPLVRLLNFGGVFQAGFALQFCRLLLHFTMFLFDAFEVLPTSQLAHLPQRFEYG